MRRETVPIVIAAFWLGLHALDSLKTMTTRTVTCNYCRALRKCVAVAVAVSILWYRHTRTSTGPARTRLLFVPFLLRSVSHFVRTQTTEWQEFYKQQQEA